MAIKGIAFDLEGTIIDVERLHFEAFLLVAAGVGVFFDRDHMMEDFALKIPRAIGGGEALISEGISRLAGGRVSAAEIRHRKVALYHEKLRELPSIEPRPGFLKVFEEIRRLGLRVAIASLTTPDQAEILLERSGIGKLFPKNCTLLEGSVKNLKPAPDVYLEAARRMGVLPPKQLVFEDSKTGLMAARAAGSPVIAMPIYTFPENIRELREAGAVKIVFSWEEVNIVQILQELNN